MMGLRCAPFIIVILYAAFNVSTVDHHERCLLPFIFSHLVKNPQGANRIVSVTLTSFVGAFKKVLHIIQQSLPNWSAHALLISSFQKLRNRQRFML